MQSIFSGTKSISFCMQRSLSIMPNALKMRTLFHSRDVKIVSTFCALINIITAKLA